jgi:hypoxanthine phosphoribosyltransferase
MKAKAATEKRHTEEVLITARRLQNRVQALARAISRDYEGKDLTLVAVLKGSVIFLSDLLRSLSINCSIDFISVSSYKGTRSSGVVRLITDLRKDPVGKHLLLVEDIVDTGTTLAYLQQNLLTRQPASVRTCVLLDKYSARKVPVDIHYRGFVIPDRFVVGYGLDHNEAYRGLPYIGVMRSGNKVRQGRNHKK